MAMLSTLTVTRALARLGLHPPGTAPFPTTLTPMLTEGSRHAFNDPEWVYEPKWDGFRVVALIRNHAVRLLSRNLHSFTGTFRPVTDALREFPTTLVLDGEVVVLNEQGLPDFEALQQWLRPHRHMPGPVTYMVFDCLYVNGHSVLRRGLEDRQAVLRALRPALAPETVRITEALSGMDGRLVFRECARLGLEGVVAKRRASLYRPGVRTRDWMKISVRHREEFVVGGYLMVRPNRLSTLIVGQYDRTGTLRYVGLVGTGLSEETRRAILRELEATPRKTCPFVPAPTLRDHFGQLRANLPPHWVKPTLVIEVEYRQRTGDGLRHAALKGLRPDRNARGVRGQALGK